MSSAEFFHGALELLEEEVPLFLVKGEGKCQTLNGRVERFAEKIADHLVIAGPRDYPLNGINDVFHWIIAPYVVSTLLMDRLAVHFEHHTSHDLNIHRYYRQFGYQAVLMTASRADRYTILRNASQRVIIRPYRAETDGRIRFSFSFKQAGGHERTDDLDAARCGLQTISSPPGDDK